MSFVIGVDVGGTFTDAVAAGSDGRVVSAKAPSTPPDYSGGIIEALTLLAKQWNLTLPELLADTAKFSHGTTSSLNALVMRKVPPVGYLTTAGHRDALYIMNVEGRYLGRPQHELQDPLRQRKPEPLVPRRLAREIVERIDSAGRIVVALDEVRARRAIRELRDAGVSAFAISLLWAFRNPLHERRLKELIDEEAPGAYVALSSEVSPRIREFARAATTVMSSQIGPGLRDYLGRLETRLTELGLRVPLLVMQSSGGAVTATEAPATAITTVGSVLTGGVVGALRLARQTGRRNVIATDVGGTTFLVGLIVDGEPVRTTSTIINQHPVNVPSLQVHAIGSGGGALAWVDQGGHLRVGPLSAQAVPGPACYGHGGLEPTVTDANLVLGILPERGLLGGRRPLSRELAEKAIAERVGRPLGLGTLEAAAAIHAVQNAQTADLLRKVVVESGHDPQDFSVFAFGGAGPAHCAAYAADLGAREVVVPLGGAAAGFSAFGLAGADIMVSAERSDPQPCPMDPGRVAAIFDDLERDVRSRLARQGEALEEQELRREIDLRYSLQLSEVTTPLAAGPVTTASLEDCLTEFERLYQRMHGENTGFRQAGMFAVTFRVHGVGRTPQQLRLPDIGTADSELAASARRPVCLDGTDPIETDVYDYRLLRAGHRINGPAIVEVDTTTVVVPATARGEVDALGNLVMTFG
ncbi:hydantoinase/oxoprolinase family protein [Actinomadura montaniterrae]|uniref:Hydantoinase/oxoprolinase family protein n=1 Tax=Actinomadura montaniterrae TaxID=1803903 RepID=A0A6L3VY48_9ACTN|nr:hydantoinase/oxoprolinase family protein [Actinomadura montaniterrae]KAB2384826.1 hydantoinase/oxoprolinase family protein [Actinomadura montaniterrae]